MDARETISFIEDIIDEELVNDLGLKGLSIGLMEQSFNVFKQYIVQKLDVRALALEQQSFYIKTYGERVEIFKIEEV